MPQWTFADRARKVRRDLKLGQAEMADRLGVGLKAYSAWESGKNTPEDIVTIAVLFERASGVPRTWFLGWIDDQEARSPRLNASPQTLGGQKTLQITDWSLAPVTQLIPRNHTTPTTETRALR